MVIILPRGRRRCRARGSDLSHHQTESLILPSNDLIISSISYRSYNAKHISTLYGNVFEKTDFYSSEQEIRIIVLANKSNEKNQRNLQIPIDAKGMISSIIISPFISEKLQNFISEEMIISYPYLANKISKSLLMEY